MKWIDEIVLGLIDMYGTNNPYELCDLLEIPIIKVESNNSILSGYNSVYFRYLNNQEVIYIRDDLNSHYEDFYLRHELGHAILHTRINNSLNKDLINRAKQEKQANYFAFKLGRITIDEVDLYEMTLEQICCSLELPYDAVNQLVNL